MNDADSAGSPGSPSDPGRNVRIPRPLHGSVLILLALASSSAYLTRHCLAVANTTIQKELDLNSEQMGYVFSLFALGYMIFQIPGGVVGLRIGTRNALPLFSVLWSVITVWSSLVYSLVPLLASRLTFGLAQAGLVPNTAQVIKDWFLDKIPKLVAPGLKDDLHIWLEKYIGTNALVPAVDTELVSFGDEHAVLVACVELHCVGGTWLDCLRADHGGRSGQRVTCFDWCMQMQVVCCVYTAGRLLWRQGLVSGQHTGVENNGPLNAHWKDRMTDDGISFGVHITWV